MRIAKVEIQGFRCIEKVEVVFDDVTTFIGPNGAGKSSILRALDWFFNATSLTEEDVYSGASEKKISVRVDFDHLTQADRDKLEKYGEGTGDFTAWKFWDNGVEKITGKALAFEPFERIRAAGSSTDKRRVHGEVVAENPNLDLPAWRTSEAITLAALEEWERQHSDLLTEAQVSSTNFFGFNSQGKLSGLFDYVLVTADLRASEESQDNKNSIIGRVLEKAVDRAAADAALKELSDELRRRHAAINVEHFATQLDDLSRSLSTEVGAFTSGRQVLVRSVEAEYKAQASKFRVRIGDSGTETSVERQGHGFQRSLLIAALKLLAQRGAAASDGSVICLAIEEPELFQHPSQAKGFATVLRALAEQPGSGMQVAYATHSPYFVEPRRYDQIRRVSRTAGSTANSFGVRVDHAAVGKVVTRLAGFVDEQQVTSQLDNVCVNRLSEALFASAVVLVEGPCDKGVLDGLSERATPLSVESIAVADVGGKTQMFLPFAILEQLGIPTRVLFDADANITSRMTTNHRLQRDVTASEYKSIAENRALLRFFKEPETNWPSGHVGQHLTALPDDIETLLGSEWPEWEASRTALVSSGRGVDGKNAETYRLAAYNATGGPPALLEEVLVRARELDGMSPSEDETKP